MPLHSTIFFEKFPIKTNTPHGMSHPPPIQIPQECDFPTWSIQNVVGKVKRFVRKYSVAWLITRLVVLDIALLMVLFCDCPLICNSLFHYKVFVGLVWLTSNLMFGLGNFLDKSLSWFLKILKLPSFYSINFESFMHLGNLSQIILPNMWLLVLTDSGNKLYHVEKFLISFYAISY